MLYGTTEAVARVWYFAFRNYRWESRGGTQTVSAELTCTHFDDELAYAHVRRLANSRTLSLAESDRIQKDARMRSGLARHGLTAPPPPLRARRLPRAPGRPRLL